MIVSPCNVFVCVCSNRHFWPTLVWLTCAPFLGGCWKAVEVHFTEKKNWKAAKGSASSILPQAHSFPSPCHCFPSCREKDHRLLHSRSRLILGLSANCLAHRVYHELLMPPPNTTTAFCVYLAGLPKAHRRRTCFWLIRLICQHRPSVHQVMPRLLAVTTQ
jgi:hypothetical protein